MLTLMISHVHGWYVYVYKREEAFESIYKRGYGDALKNSNKKIGDIGHDMSIQYGKDTIEAFKIWRK